MNHNSITSWSLALVLASSVAACSSPQKAQTPPVSAPTAGKAAGSKAPTQAEIIHVVTTLNNSEIQAAQLAKSKSQDPQVINLANHIIEDHTASNRQAMALADQMNVQPDGNSISRSIRTEAASTLASLKKAEGAQFTQDYLNKQLKMHQSALETLDNQLLPHASSTEMKSFLQKTRASVAAHLQQTQKLEKQTSTH